MKVKLSPWQKEVALDDHRFRIVCAGRRSGKSVLSRMIILKWATEQKGLYWIVSPNYKQSKMIHWRELNNEVPKEWIKKKNEVELSITLQNGSIIELKGAENPDTLRGVKLRGLIIDEIASIRNWDWLWHEVLRPTLTDYKAPAIFISTPKGFNHFYELFEQGQREEDNYKSWKFTSYNNPYVSKEEIDAAKQELTEDTFYQEYLADFRKFTGLVYKEFDRGVHVIKPFEIPPEWSMYRAFDWGSNNPSVCLFIAVDNDDNFYIVDEIYEPLLGVHTIDWFIGTVSANQYSKRGVVSSYADPSGKMQINEFNQKGIYVTPANKETGTGNNSWVRFKIEKVAEKLKSLPGRYISSINMHDGPSLFVFNNCINTIREFESYRWKEKSVTQAQDLNEPDVPDKANDHAMDALSYMVVSYKKMPIIHTTYVGRKRDFSLR